MTMDARRTYLKDLATQLADAWAASATPAALSGDARVDTRNTNYVFKDGVCASITRRDRAWRSDPTEMIGMRLVGFLLHDDPYAGLQQKWRPGAYAVLWRARRAGDTHSSVALTSATTAMTVERRAFVPPPLPARAVRRISTPPPLPARALQRPVSPVSMVIPKLPSMTRINVPTPPMTPTPTTQPHAVTPLRALGSRPIPPPLPARARTGSSSSHQSA